ncbi:MAG TPA: glycoside hydrolase family 130 protein [Candidatus Cloacimonadota bacterium]|nr:glycoside hydrolase family 130 protein [Candidatus Cloacimonadota bacterium]HPT70997.1 glycoside hydrolase family 130 protein [Candidatus Cloacimonadota bacterium]
MLLRYSHNPILTRKDIPNLPPDLVDVTSVFNPGAVKYGELYILLLRVQNRARETFFMIAESSDGYHFNVRPEPVHLDGIESVTEKIYHCYDARITRIEDRYYIMFAMDMKGVCKLGIAETSDFVQFRFLGITSGDDTRNGVLFPGKLNDKYLRLERPNQVQLTGGPKSGSAIWLSESPDLLNWEMIEPVMAGNPHYWDELIGSGPPPIRTKEGWLHIYHGVATHFGSTNIYQAGVVLLDLEQPQKVLVRGKYNILEPREMYELVGQVPNVVFPSGMIVEEYDEEGYALPNSSVKIYYGAADTSVCLAETTIRDLLDAVE